MAETPSGRRLRLRIRGAVQGVGFRPFVYRLATELGLAGTVANDSRGVNIEVEGPEERLARFHERLPEQRPPLAILQSVEPTWHEPVGYDGFRIVPSEGEGDKVAFVLPDVATCGQCLAELFDPADRRYGYPFINCTHCGPRFSIIQALPYDRPSTTMARFPLCARCRREYEDPLDRRFHAQPNACPECGPRLSLWDRHGRTLAEDGEALRQAAEALRRGRILALKGLGGFHLVVDAGNAAAVAELRRRKRRYDKPLALMVGRLDDVHALCEVPDPARDLLTSPPAPIVLLRRRPDATVAAEVAPGPPSDDPGEKNLHPDLGVMLAYTPLHHLLLREVDRPLVATSGNLSDEPIAIDDGEALERLGKVADLFLVHDRPIARHVDDSVVRVVEGKPQMIRRARGFAPLPVELRDARATILAVGAHLKDTVALSVSGQVFLSQHIGDMETPQACDAFQRVIEDFLDLYDATPVVIAHDLHPDYATTRWARAAAEGSISGEAGKILAGVRLVGVQHHHAHLASCLAENGCPGPALGVTWDGTGYGTDETVWGGEFLHGDAAAYRRVAALRPFRLPGGDAAVREPRRSALALLWEMLGEAALERQDLAPVAAFSDSERRVVGKMLERGLRSPVTTSAGRLFDAVAALLGVWQRTGFEGQAAMWLELVAEAGAGDAYPLPLAAGGSVALELDWRPLVEAILVDLRRGVAAGVVSARFHNALAEAVTAVAVEVGEARVALSGGCFQNRRLTERSAALLRRAGFEVLHQRQVPANDGGISLGQVAVAAARLDEG